MMRGTFFALIFCLSIGSTAIAQNDSIPQDTLTQELITMRDVPTISLSDEELGDAGGESISSILTAGRHPFLSSAEFNFSPVRFRLRGYEYSGNSIYINGLNFSGLENGYIPFGLWSGLNNVMRSRQTSYGLETNDFNFGTIGLNTNIDMRAGAQWVQTQIGYANSNRNYRHRVTFNHSSGFNKKGWAYSLAWVGRYADEGYVPGTYYRGMSYYAAVDKKTSDKNTLSFITFGSPTENGRQGGSVQEAMDLAGTNFYNPSWGYQNGKKRNANVLNTFQPAFILSNQFKPNNNSNWTTSVAYLFGNRKTSALDWYNAPDPRPDYYRYLPSYFSGSAAENLAQTYIDNPDRLQVNWDALYDANNGNQVTVNNINGEPNNSISGKRSLYLLSNRVIGLNRLMATTVYSTKLSNVTKLTVGANFQNQINHYYQEANDLLGGDFWLNVNQFAERDFPNSTNEIQFDLDNPNRVIKQGDQYGYNYKLNMTELGAWAQVNFTLRKFDLFLTGGLSTTSFYRNGLIRSGLFPNNSYGKSEVQKFINPSGKAGVTYKLDGRNYFFANGGYVTNAPFFQDVFISPRTRNDVQKNLTNQKIITTEAGYKFISPKAKIMLTGYYTTINDAFDMMTFYHDEYRNFVNYAISGIDKLFFGGELGAEIKLTPTLTWNSALSVGRYYYNSRQNAVISVDNSNESLPSQTVYLENFRVPSSPQNAYSTGLFYRSPKYWYISLTGNYFHNMWLSPNPLRRTLLAIDDLDPELPTSQTTIDRVLEQEKFDGQFTLDFFGGWSYRLPKQYNIKKNKPTYLVFNLSVNNILNNKNIRSGGYEQLRFDYTNKDVNKFPPKYYYAYGLNYFASVALRF